MQMQRVSIRLDLDPSRLDPWSSIIEYLKAAVLTKFILSLLLTGRSENRHNIEFAHK